MARFGLSTSDLEKIKKVLSSYQQIEEVLIYGSRAKGNYKPASDIDLTLIGKNIDLALQLQLESDLDDLLLPYKFDISVFDKIENPAFIDHIQRVGVTFYTNQSL